MSFHLWMKVSFVFLLYGWNLVAVAADAATKLAHLKQLYRDKPTEAKPVGEAMLKDADFSRPSQERLALMSLMVNVYKSLSEFETGIEMAHKGIELSQSMQDRDFRDDLYNGLGNNQYMKGDYVDALQSYKTALSLARETGDMVVEANALGNVGNIYFVWGDYEQVLVPYGEALKIRQESGDPRGMVVSLENLGLVYQNLGRYETALDYYNQSLSLAREHGLKGDQAYCLNSIGSVYDALGEDEKAHDFFVQTLELEQELGNRSGMAYALHDLGSVLMQQGKLEDAERYLTRAMTLREELGEKSGQVKTGLDLGRLYQRKGLRPQALAYLRNALEIANRLGEKHNQMAAHLELAAIYEENRQLEAAVSHWRQAFELKETLFDEALKEEAAFMQAKFDSERKDQEIALLKKETELQKARTRREALIRNLVILGLSLGFTLVFLTYYRYIRNRQKRLVLREKMAGLASLTRGLAHQINTPLGIGITAISYLQTRMDSVRAKYHEEVLTADDMDLFFKETDQTTKLLETNLGKASGLVRNLKKVVDDHKDEKKRRFRLKPYLEFILQSFEQKLEHKGLTCIIEDPQEIEIESFPSAISLVISHLVTNSIEHGYEGLHKGQLKIELQKDGQGALLIYRDDGKGIAQENLKRIFDPFYSGKVGSGLGLFVVYNQVSRHLRGRIRCQSKPGQGVTFQIFLPG